MRDTIPYQLRNEQHTLEITYGLFFDPRFRFFVDGTLIYSITPWHNLAFTCHFVQGNDFSFR